LRLPYTSLINAAGKFKETRTSAIIEAISNIAVSVILVSKFGLIGVAIGTFVAMAYRTISFMIFLHKDVICLSIGTQIKRYLLSFVIYGALVYAASLINIEITHYMSWILYTGITFAATGVVTLLVNLLVMRKETVAVIKTFIRRLPKKRANS
jgi:O-antigen/teichoic acid export membrane protein